MCSTFELHKKKVQFFLWCGKVGGGGGGGGGGGLHGVSEGGGVG